MNDPPVEFAPRTHQLPDGRLLTVRQVDRDDAESLHALFAGLGVEARRRRFFAGGPPPRQVAEHMADVACRGGFGLVAEVGAGTPGAHIVAEATFTPLEDGDAELGMTVADGWRGWLGPYLLDALAGEAAARGLANLEADVLVDNGPMLAVLRARGAVVMRRPEWTVVRMLVGATSGGPVWPPSGRRPRVLVEAPVAHWHALEAVRATGAEVLVCRGPASSLRGCPALEGAPCPLAAGADLIVMSRTPDDEDWTALRKAHRSLHGGVPLCIEATTGRLAGGTGSSLERSIQQALVTKVGGRP